MFYERLMNLCKERKVRPSPVLKSLGISAGNLVRWENGGSVNSHTLQKIAGYFDVPVDYFLNDDYIMPVKDDDTVVLIAKKYPDYINSIMHGESIPSDTLIRIANYMHCPTEYFLTDDKGVISDERHDNGKLDEKELIIDVLSRLPDTRGYKHLQVMISRIIATNLSRHGITADMLAVAIPKKKADALYNSTTDNAKIQPFTNSDIIHIVQSFPISYDTLFTGI